MKSLFAEAPRRISRMIAITLLLLIASALFVTGPELWSWATTKRVHTCIEQFAGWETVNRFTGENCGEVCFWDLDSGRLVTRGWRTDDEEDWTFFSPEGKISGPRPLDGLGPNHPLRRWESRAIAPWVEAGLTYEEWYRIRHSESCVCLDASRRSSGSE